MFVRYRQSSPPTVGPAKTPQRKTNNKKTQQENTTQQIINNDLDVVIHTLALIDHHGTQDRQSSTIAPFLCVRALQVNGTSRVPKPCLTSAACLQHHILTITTGTW